jgi:GT2 family glycosyltransferase
MSHESESVSTSLTPPVGVLAIGRNEGERLRTCLASALAISPLVIYVDSGSTDGSTTLAASLGAIVVDLDLSTSFTAARARNAGFEKLVELHPDTEFVFFTDGDCEIVSSFIPKALEAIAMDGSIAVVCGRRRERYPDASIYNQLCDIEWNTPVGEAKSCGGDALMRTSAFKAVGGFNPAVIAGEEPELCVRLRAGGHKILRIDAEMTLHDAAMTRFGQWWKRNVRGGHAYAQGAAMHGAPPEKHWVKEVRSNDFWGFTVPAVAIVLGLFTRGIGGILLLVLAYDLLGFKIYRHVKPKLGSKAGLYSFFIVVGKIPQALGQLRFRMARLLGRRPQIIEYKTAAAGAS